MDSELPSSPATMSDKQEATGDSESDSAADRSVVVDADEGDAESCCGEEDSDSAAEEMQGGPAPAVQGRRLVSWGCWMVKSANASRHMAADGGMGEGTHSSMEVAAEEDAESDRLFWEACMTHGY